MARIVIVRIAIQGTSTRLRKEKEIGAASSDAISAIILEAPNIVALMADDVASKAANETKVRPPLPRDGSTATARAYSFATVSFSMDMLPIAISERAT